MKLPADLRRRGWMPTQLMDGTRCLSRPGTPLDTDTLPDGEGKSPWGYVTAPDVDAARALDEGKFGRTE